MEISLLLIQKVLTIYTLNMLRTQKINNYCLIRSASEFSADFSENTMIVVAQSENEQFPIARIIKPFNISDEEWSDIRGRIEIKLKK